jgi:glycosyltransferase involved in cell wall biosynthesis
MPGQPPVIAYVTPKLPWPPRSGGQKRLVMTLEALAALGPVHLIIFSFGPVEGEVPPGGLFASIWIREIARPSLGRRIFDRGASLVQLKLPYEARWNRVGGPELLAQRVGSVAADIVFLAWPFYAGGVAAVRMVAPLVAADIVDDRVAAQIGVIRHGPGVRARLRALVDLPALERHEAGIGELDQAWFVRDSDARRFSRRHFGLDVRAIPTAVDVEHLAGLAANCGLPRPRSAAFLGSFAHRPNQVAALRFALGIAPILRRQAPDADLALIGRRPTAEIRRAGAAAGVQLLADVPDAAEVLCEFAVLVAPLSSGEGSNVKILEALALRVPVVTTPVALEGLDLVDGVHVMVGQSDEELARAVLRIWSNPALAGRLRDAGAALIHRRYGGASFKTLVANAIRDLQERGLSAS